MISGKLDVMTIRDDDKLLANGCPNHIGKKTVTYKTPFMHVYHCRANFGAATKDYYVIKFRPRVGVVVVQDESVLLVSQYRYLLDANSWELPGGSIEHDESPEKGLVRECIEETGVHPLNLSLLITYYPGLDNVDNCTRVYHTSEFEVQTQFVVNPLEVNALAWIPIDKALVMVRQGEILDAMTISGLLAYDSMINKMRTPSLKSNDKT